MYRGILFAIYSELNYESIQFSIISIEDLVKLPRIILSTCIQRTHIYHPHDFISGCVYIIIYDDIRCSTNCIFKCAHGKNGIHTLRSEVLLIHIYTKLSRVWKSQVARQERRKRIIKLLNLVQVPRRL